MKIKIPLSMKIRNLFSPCRKCKKGIGYHCLYCYKSVPTAPQTKVNILSKRILELQADKGKLTDKVRELEAENEKLKVDNAFYEKACEGTTLMYEHLTKVQH